MSRQFYAILLILFVLSSCKSAEKSYNRGDYHAAVEQAAKKLAKKPGDYELITIIKDAYRYAVDDHEAKIRNLGNSQNELRAEQILAQYNSLQGLYETIRRSPSAYQAVKPTDYSAELQTYREEAGAVRESRGDRLMEQQDKLSFREAYREYQKALSFGPGNTLLKQKMDDAYLNAITHISVQPLTRFGFQFTNLGYNYNQFNSDLLRYLNQQRRDEFTNFYGLNQPGVRADYAVEMRFSDVQIGRYRDSRDTREVSKQVVSREIVHKPDSVTKEYITVKAKITTTTRRMQAFALLQTLATDTRTNSRVWSEIFRGDYNWVGQFASFTGDERALSEADKQLINAGEQWPPDDEYIINIIMQEIQQKTQCGISEFFLSYRF